MDSPINPEISKVGFGEAQEPVDSFETVEDVLTRLPPQPFYRNKGLLKLYSVLIPGVLLCTIPERYF